MVQIGVIEYQTGGVLLNVVIDHGKTCSELTSELDSSELKGSGRIIDARTLEKYYSDNQTAEIAVLPRVTLDELADLLDQFDIRNAHVSKWSKCYCDWRTIANALDERIDSLPPLANVYRACIESRHHFKLYRVISLRVQYIHKVVCPQSPLIDQHQLASVDMLKLIENVKRFCEHEKFLEALGQMEDNEDGEAEDNKNSKRRGGSEHDREEDEDDQGEDGNDDDQLDEDEEDD